jgi:ABC transporter substrate binding protein
MESAMHDSRRYRDSAAECLLAAQEACELHCRRLLRACRERPSSGRARSSNDHSCFPFSLIPPRLFAVCGLQIRAKGNADRGMNVRDSNGATIRDDRATERGSAAQINWRHGACDLTASFDFQKAAFSRSQSFTRQVDSVVVTQDGEFAAGFSEIATLAVANKLPSIGAREYAEAGGLIGYGADILGLYRRAAYFVDRILKGAKPADLPIEQPTKFELVVNLRTAKTTGLGIAETFLVRADEVIE